MPTSAVLRDGWPTYILTTYDTITDPWQLAHDRPYQGTTLAHKNGYAKSISLHGKRIQIYSEPIRFIPKSVSEPIRTHPSQSEISETLNPNESGPIFQS